MLSDSDSSISYEFAGYRLDPARRSLTDADGGAVKLTGRPFDTLVYLVEHAGEVVDRDALVHAVWPRRVVEDNNLNQAIAVLRRLLGEQHIVTVAGRGYQFVTPVHAVVVGPDESTGPSDPPSPPSRPRFAWLYPITALVVLAVALMAIDRYGNAPRSTTARIAVLPCDNLSPDPNDSYFAAGIHDELVNRLKGIRNLVVISRSSVLQYADNRPSIPQIGADLRVATIMECTVRYDGDQVILAVQLIDAATDEHLWSRSYPGDTTDLHSQYEIQAEIATNVANALRVEFLDEELAQIKQAPTDSPDARAYYLASVGAPTNERQIELLEHALEFDPEYIDAWIRKALRHMLFAGFMTGEKSVAAHAAGLEAINRALDLDPNSGKAHAMLALYHGQIGEWMNSEIEWRRAIGLGMNPAEGDHSLVMMAVGHVAEAIPAMEARVDRDPLIDRSSLLLAYEVVGKKDERHRHWKRGEELLGLWAGDRIESSLRILEDDKEFLRTEVPREVADFYGAVWSEGVGNLDSPADGLAAMRSLHANPELATAEKLRLMTVWALHFGDPALALQWFRESVELLPTIMLNAWLPAFAPLRREPGFKDLVRDQALPEYWNKYDWPLEFCRPTEGDDFECD